MQVWLDPAMSSLSAVGSVSAPPLLISPQPPSWRGTFSIHTHMQSRYWGPRTKDSRNLYLWAALGIAGGSEGCGSRGSPVIYTSSNVGVFCTSTPSGVPAHRAPQTLGSNPGVGSPAGCVPSRADRSSALETCSFVLLGLL